MQENTRLRLTIQRVLGMIENGNTLLLSQAERACRDALTVDIREARLTDDLTFRAVATTNRIRCEESFNHALHDWSTSDWGVAMAGEAGEVCNAIKKMNRLLSGIQRKFNNMPLSLDEAKADIAKEIGDTYLYLDLLAQSLELKMEDCVREAFNKVSKREGSCYGL